MLLIAKKADLWRLDNFRGPVSPLEMLNEPIRHHQRIESETEKSFLSPLLFFLFHSLSAV
jgi:hypothetical protein